MWQTLTIRVVFRASSQLFGDNELTEWDAAVLEVLTNLGQVFVQSEEDLVALLA